MKPLGRRNPLAFLSLLLGIAISIALSWFAANQYRMSFSLAEENLRGLALSLSAAVEALVAKDPAFASLRDFQTTDIAYIALIDRNGIILFHTNSALTGERLSDRRTALVFEKGEFTGNRVLLGTGETVYESNAPIHAGGKTLALRLALHTYRADRIVGNARLGLLVVGSLITVAWIMALFLYRYARREKIHAMEMAQQRELARLGEMGAIIAHEIRNPLAGIKGYAQLLQEKHGTEEDAPCAELIVGEAIRLEEIVNGLLAYTQKESTPPSPVRIHDALTRSLAVISTEADQIGVRLECLLDRSFMIAGNRDRLEQLFFESVQKRASGHAERWDNHYYRSPVKKMH